MRGKPKKRLMIKEVLSVSRKVYLSPHFIRVYLTGENIELFSNTTVGINNKIAIPPKGVDAVNFPEMNSKEKSVDKNEKSSQAIIRTYTHRGIDLESRELWIDFVVHGDNGPASAWALQCKEGELLGVMMKNNKLELYKKVKNYILVGDATALPVISSILEDLAPDATGHCFLEVYGKEDEIEIPTKADINFHWLHNPHPEEGSRLADEVMRLQSEMPSDDRFAYIACEFETVKRLRYFFRKDKLWTNQEVYAYLYWKSGISEDRSVVDRRKEKNELDL